MQATQIGGHDWSSSSVKRSSHHSRNDSTRAGSGGGGGCRHVQQMCGAPDLRCSRAFRADRSKSAPQLEQVTSTGASTVTAGYAPLWRSGPRPDSSRRSHQGRRRPPEDRGAHQATAPRPAPAGRARARPRPRAHHPAAQTGEARRLDGHRADAEAASRRRAASASASASPAQSYAEPAGPTDKMRLWQHTLWISNSCT